MLTATFKGVKQIIKRLGPHARAVGRLHNSRAAAGQRRETRPGQFAADGTGQFVITMILFEACRAEYCHGGADIVEPCERPCEFLC